MSVCSVVVTLLLAATLLYTAYYFFSIKKPRLYYQNSDLNRRLIQAVPALTAPYFTTPWLLNTHIHMLYLGLVKSLAKTTVYDRRDILRLADGGHVSVEWLGLDIAPSTPTLLVLHTLSGSPKSMGGFVRDMQRQLGWRVALCVRRGHGELKLASANYNVLGSSQDFAAQVAHIQQCFPESPLYATGVSAGSGVLVHYLGSVGQDTPIKAAVAYCPAYDAERALPRVKPFYTQAMTKKLIRLFITPNRRWFEHLPSYHTLLNSRNLAEFYNQSYAVAGYQSSAELMAKHNPSPVMSGISVPILMLNAEDDPVCVIDNLHDQQATLQQMETCIVAVTRYGSHCGFFAGLSAKPWANRLIAEYFQACRQLPRP